MWLTSSSIGRKVVMALTGLALVLFVTFHVLMNAVALIWPTAYNQVCEFLGANWYALVASAGLALLFIIHIFYAVWLTVQNRAARGTDRYAVTSRPPQVEWSSKNMLVLGIVIVAFLVVHLIQFWAKMQLQELRHGDITVLPQLEGVPCSPAMGTLFLQMAFSQWYTPVIYIIGFAALWFHMNHGFWSMFHSIGWDNNIWISRLKTAACWWTSVVIALFVAQTVVFTVRANEKFYTNDPALQAQYGEYWVEKAEELKAEVIGSFEKVAKKAEAEKYTPEQQQDAMLEYFLTEGKVYSQQASFILEAAKKQCSNISLPVELAEFEQFAGGLNQQVSMAEFYKSKAAMMPAGAQGQEAVAAEEEAAAVAEPIDINQ